MTDLAFQDGVFQPDAYQIGQVVPEGFQCDAFQADAFQNICVIPPPQNNILPGGSGYPVYGKQRIRKRFDQKLKEWIDEWFGPKEAYAELVRPDVPKPVQREAAKLVKGFADSADAIPPAEAVDWAALVEQSKKVHALLGLYEERVRQGWEDDDEEAVLAMMI